MAILIWKAPMRYYALRDEAAFFEWLQEIPGIVSVRGIGHELHIQTRSTRLRQDAIRELVAVYRRYGGNLEELLIFRTPTNENWLDSMIGAKPRNAPLRPSKTV